MGLYWLSDCTSQLHCTSQLDCARHLDYTGSELYQTVRQFGYTGSCTVLAVIDPDCHFSITCDLLVHLSGVGSVTVCPVQSNCQYTPTACLVQL